MASSLWTTTREQVLKDIENRLGQSERNALPPTSIEAGGSGNSYTGAGTGGDTTATASTDALKQGVDYFAIPPTGPYGPNQDFAFDSAQVRFGYLDAYLRYIVEPIGSELRVMPGVYPVDSLDPTNTLGDGETTYSATIQVYRTNARPFRHKRALYTYDGARLDLASFIPGSGSIKVLITLDPTLIAPGFDATGASLHVETDSAIVGDPARWSDDTIPLAVVTLDAAAQAEDDFGDTAGLQFADIEDVRPLVTWYDSGIGAVPVTFVIAAVDSINPDRADYRCTGTNDEVVINQAISDLGTTGGKLVFLEGNYQLYDTVTVVKSYVVFEGEGKASVLHRHWNQTAPHAKGMITVGDGGTTPVSYFEAANMAFDGHKATYASANNFIVLFNRKVSYSFLDDCHYQNSGGHAIYTYAPTIDDGCDFNKIRNNLIESNTGDGIRIEGNTSWNLLGENLVVSNGGNGITLSGCDKNRVTENSCFSNTGDGIYASTGEGNSITRNDATDNSMHGIAAYEQTQGLLNSNELRQNTLDGLNVDSCLDCAISGNSTWNNFQTGIHVVGGGVTNASRHAISANTSNGNLADGILIEAAGYNAITGNVINDPATACAGITLASNASTNLIDGNQIRYSISGSVAIKIASGCASNEIGINVYTGVGEPITDGGTNTLDGASIRRVASVSAALYTASLANILEVDSTAAPITIQLPDPTICKGRAYDVMLVAGTNAVTVDAGSAFLIFDTRTKVLTGVGTVFLIRSNGVKWNIWYTNEGTLGGLGTRGEDHFVGGVGQTVFVLSHAPRILDATPTPVIRDLVFRFDGLIMSEGSSRDYTVGLDGVTITMTATPPTGRSVDFIYTY